MVAALVLFWITLVLVGIGSNAAGEFSVLHSPDSLNFLTSDKTLESLLKEIFSAALGLSVEQHSEWKGMFVVDPFNTPEAVVEVYIDGVSSLDENVSARNSIHIVYQENVVIFEDHEAQLKSKTYPLIADEYEPDTFKGVKHRIKQRCTGGGNKIVNIKLSDENELFKDVFGDVTSYKLAKHNLIYLKHTVEEDYHFLNELRALQAIIGRVQNGAVIPDNIIDFYNFRFRTLHTLSDFHGPNSLQTKEAKKLLGGALQELSKAFVKAYNSSVLVTAVTTDVAHTRRAARSISSASFDFKPTKDLLWPFDWIDPPPNWQSHPHRYMRPDGSPDYGWIAKDKSDESNADFDADYAAMFNILLWFGVLMSFSILAIIYACMDMDPGRDSIIYRMTSTRMKKDN